MNRAPRQGARGCSRRCASSRTARSRELSRAQSSLDTGFGDASMGAGAGDGRSPDASVASSPDEAPAEYRELVSDYFQSHWRVEVIRPRAPRRPRRSRAPLRRSCRWRAAATRAPDLRRGRHPRTARRTPTSASMCRSRRRPAAEKSAHRGARRRRTGTWKASSSGTRRPTRWGCLPSARGWLIRHRDRTSAPPARRRPGPPLRRSSPASSSSHARRPPRSKTPRDVNRMAASQGAFGDARRASDPLEPVSAPTTIFVLVHRLVQARQARKPSTWRRFRTKGPRCGSTAPPSSLGRGFTPAPPAPRGSTAKRVALDAGGTASTTSLSRATGDQEMCLVWRREKGRRQAARLHGGRRLGQDGRAEVTG